MYASYADYAGLYGEISQEEFNRFAHEADRALDTATTGIDNIKKLKVAFPHNDVDAIIYCACKVINTLKQISDIQASTGYANGVNGMTGKVVSSVSSGNESISYSAGDTAITRAAVDTTEKAKLIRDTIRASLSGITDANGVNLLYMGVYPCTTIQ